MILLDAGPLTCSYGGVVAVRDVSVTVDEGEIVTLIGSNGAGKTTLLRAISGVLENAMGPIIFAGDRIEKLSPARRVRAGLSQVPEGRQIFGPMRVLEHLELGAYVRNGAKREDLDRIFSTFPVLKQKAKLEARSLSGGEQQMLSIARALMARPKLLLLDEPSMGLAPKLVQEIFQIIAALRTAGTAILLVEQNAIGALQISDRGYVLENGRVVLSGPAATLRADSRVKEAYLGLGVSTGDAAATTPLPEMTRI